jgi:S-DNA-T family DNA segregation ATPase FtsK/SpoIIIE
MFQGIMGDGRPVGVHVVISADRPAALPSSLSSAVNRRLVLRLANDMDYSMLGAPADAFSAASPPGRGFLDGREVQVGVLGGDPNVARQAHEISRLSASMARAGVLTVPRVMRLPDRILASDLPSVVNGEPVLGMWDETLEPVTFDPSGVFLISGPPQSGRTTALAAVVRAIRHARPATKFLYLGRRRSPLVGLQWDVTALTPDEIDVAAADWAAKIAGDAPEATDFVVVIEGVGELLNSAADLSVQELVKACRSQERFVVAEGETSSLAGSWPLLQAVKAGRYGVSLQPEQIDGDSLYKTSFGRLNRSEFPQGRGLYVRSGRTYRVQVALPE